MLEESEVSLLNFFPPEMVKICLKYSQYIFLLLLKTKVTVSDSIEKMLHEISGNHFPK